MLAVITENVNDFLKDDSQDLNPVFYQIMIRLIYVHQKYMPLFQQAQQMAFFDDEIKRYTEQSDAASLLVFEKILQHYLKAEPEYLHAKAYVIFYASEGIIHNISSSNLSEAEREKILTESVRLFSGYFLSLIDQK
ncbi:MAG: hypothetical protein LWX83_02665 [Anaerolineae bacterium]|nr:hypothetical protein [Anaerolineae bacterium]